MYGFSLNNTNWRIQELSIDRYSETNYCCCEAKWKSYCRVGWDYRFWKQCTVHGVRASEDYIRGTISLLLSTCQTLYKKGNV